MTVLKPAVIGHGCIFRTPYKQALVYVCVCVCVCVSESVCLYTIKVLETFIGQFVSSEDSSTVIKI